MIGYLYEVNPNYELLEKILEPYYTDIRYSMNVNIIIDFKQLIRKVFREPNNFEDEMLDSHLIVEEISSAMLNIIGHYRNFFYKQNKYTTFYILYSKSLCDELKIVNSDYKKDFYNKYVNNDNHRSKFANKVTSIVEIICKYIPHCSFIDTSDYDESAYINSFVKKSPSNELNILLSDDVCLYQYLNDNTIALNMKGINTKVITDKTNVAEYFSSHEVEDKYLAKFSNKLLPVMLAMSGYNKYSLTGIPSVKYKKAIKILNELIYDSYIEDAAYINFPLEYKHLEKYGVSEKVFQNVRSNFYSMIADRKLTVINLSTISTKFIQVPIIVSISEMNRINNKFFSTFSLNLDMIWKGEKI